MPACSTFTILELSMLDQARADLLPDSSSTLRDDERQRCEVWTRVMGYHRPVASFNVGKKGEHRERRFFREARALPSLAG